MPLIIRVPPSPARIERAVCSHRQRPAGQWNCHVPPPYAYTGNVRPTTMVTETLSTIVVHTRCPVNSFVTASMTCTGDYVVCEHAQMISRLDVPSGSGRAFNGATVYHLVYYWRTNTTGNGLDPLGPTGTYATWRASCIQQQKAQACHESEMFELWLSALTIYDICQTDKDCRLHGIDNPWHLS